MLSYTSEEYYCNRCSIEYSFLDMNLHWKCLKCNYPVGIRIFTDTKDNMCYRVKAIEVTEDDMILIERDWEYFRIYKIIDRGDKLQFNLKDFGRWTCPKDEYILTLQGGWFKH